MADNKLGVDEITACEIADKLVPAKAALLGYNITFGCKTFDLDYLCKLHDFLFGDVYYDAGRVSDRYDPANYKEIETRVNHLYALICDKANVDEIRDAMFDLIDMQIFEDGNNRTVHLFIKLIVILD